MKAISVACIVLAATSVCGCGQQPDAASSGRHGRYLGIGTYSPGQLWARMAQSGKPHDAAAATVADDEHIIVVVDSQTGEVRECGDYSGRCVSMNPWTRAIAPDQATPVRLTTHAADLADEAPVAGEAATRP